MMKSARVLSYQNRAIYENRKGNSNIMHSSYSRWIIYITDMNMYLYSEVPFVLLSWEDSSSLYNFSCKKWKMKPEYKVEGLPCWYRLKSSAWHMYAFKHERVQFCCLSHVISVGYRLKINVFSCLSFSVYDVSISCLNSYMYTSIRVCIFLFSRAA